MQPSQEEEKEKKSEKDFFFVACSDSLQRRKSSQTNIVFFEEYTLSPTLGSIQSKVCHPEIQQAASSQIRAVPKPSSLPLSSIHLISFSLRSAAFLPFISFSLHSCLAAFLHPNPSPPVARPAEDLPSLPTTTLGSTCHTPHCPQLTAPLLFFFLTY